MKSSPLVKKLANQTDRRSAQHPVRNQGAEPTCVAFALTALRECIDDASVLLSPRYLYHYCKISDGIPDEPGTYILTGAQTLFKNGVCEDLIWPYQSLPAPVPSEADSNALKYRAHNFVRLDDSDPQVMLKNLKTWLATKGCFVAGIWVYESWGQSQAFTTGVIPEPTVYDKCWGGHAICITGYNDEKNYFSFKNSWGQDWGDSGYGYISYDHLMARCFETWGILSSETENPQFTLRRWTA